MKRLYRLRNKDVRMALRKGRRFSSLLFRVTTRKNEYSYARFAFVVSRAVDKRAVVRNLLRRRVREWVRRQLRLLDEPIDVVVTFTKEAVHIPRQKLYEELETMFRKIVGQ